MQVLTDISKDGKKIYESSVRRIFYGVPKPPYDIGDLWIVGSNNPMKVCNLKRLVGEYEVSDWGLASNATDDSGLITFIDDTYTPKVSSLDGDVATAQSTANTASTNASTALSTANTASANANNALSTASTAQTTANSKAKIFYQTSTPTSITIGDLWFDSDDNNKPYRAASIGATTIASGKWEPVQDNSVVRYSTVASKIMSLGGVDNGDGILEVYNDTGTKTGTFDKDGIALNSGNFTVLEDGIKCSTLQLENLVQNHSFELLRSDGLGGFEEPEAIYDWSKNGSPKLFSNLGTDVFSSAKYSNQYIATNSTNSVTQQFLTFKNMTYSISAYTMKGTTPYAGTPRIKVEYFKDDGTGMGFTSISSFTVDLTATTSWKRVAHTFTTIDNNDLILMKITLLSTGSEYVYWDAVQNVNNILPCIYNPENQLWAYINEQLSIKPYIPDENLGGFIKLIKSTTQSISATTQTEIVWASVETNSTTCLSKSGNKVVIGAGVKTILIKAQYQMVATNTKYIYVYKNTTLMSAYTINGDQSIVSILDYIDVIEGDQISVQCYTSTAGTITSGAAWSYFKVMIVA